MACRVLISLLLLTVMGAGRVAPRLIGMVLNKMAKGKSRGRGCSVRLQRMVLPWQPQCSTSAESHGEIGLLPLF